jgi:signal transduction histidine kinase
VSEVVTLYQKSAAVRRVGVVCHCRPTIAIRGFPGQLRQIFSNLVRNAAEAAPPGTEVAVRVRSIYRGGREGARITIHDRGPGIPRDVRKQIFDPFFTTKELKGSGLGLWVSRKLVMDHHGTIRFRTSTREGASGTTFEVFLPVGGMAENSLQSDAA